MEQESGLMRVVKRILGKDRTPPQKVPGLIPGPMLNPKPTSSSERVKTVTNPANPDINQTSEVKINPQEFNQKHKN